MKTTASVLQAIAGITGLALIVLGLFLWFGQAYQLLQLHIGLGVVLVVALLVQAALAARAGAKPGLVAFAIAWAIVVPVFGMAQMNLLPGDFHWIIRVLHLVVGLVAMRLVGVLGMIVKGGVTAGPEARTQQAS